MMMQSHIRNNVMFMTQAPQPHQQQYQFHHVPQFDDAQHDSDENRLSESTQGNATGTDSEDEDDDGEKHLFETEKDGDTAHYKIVITGSSFDKNKGANLIQMNKNGIYNFSTPNGVGL